MAVSGRNLNHRGKTSHSHRGATNDNVAAGTEPTNGRNVGVKGGAAPVRAYMPALMDDVLAGYINPGRVFDFETTLAGVAEAYTAMDERRAIKSLLRVGAID